MASGRCSSLSHSVRAVDIFVLIVRSPSGPSNPPNVLVIIGYRAPRVAPTTGIAILATDNIYVKAAGTVSLATHALATVLIAYKAWCVL